ncbi:hypothetical protein Rs2_44080 [Raphanus sativus]|nr:hypothetical protein Rs2_44080 [Raphanus sativus]
MAPVTCGRLMRRWRRSLGSRTQPRTSASWDQNLTYGYVRCSRERLHDEGHGNHKHRRTRKIPGRGVPFRIRPVSLLPMLIRGLPRHSLPSHHASNYTVTATSPEQSTSYSETPPFVFQGCNIRPRQPLPKQYNTITAQGRKGETSTLAP